MANLFDDLDLLSGKGHKINNYLYIHQPKLKEIKKYGEQKYYGIISAFISTPNDYKVQLFDSGIDYCAISDYDLFLLLTRQYTLDHTKLILPTLDIPLCDFQITINQNTNQPVLWNENTDIIIDKAIYTQISMFFCKIHYITKKSPKTDEASKKYFIDRERRRQERHKNEPFKSAICPEIIALVNCNHFKYDYDSVWNLPIFDFNSSVRQIQKLKHIDHVLSGIYAGTIDAKKIDSSDLNWMDISK
jgi:hypothetical protein